MHVKAAGVLIEKKTGKPLNNLFRRTALRTNRRNRSAHKVQGKFYTNLPSDQLEQKTKSGDSLLSNRIAWGKSYLKKGGFDHYPKRGMVQITEKGKQGEGKGYKKFHRSNEWRHHKGVFVTTSDFDSSAIKKVHDAHHTIILIDGQKLADLMLKYNVGVQIRDTYEIKEIDEDFFEAN